MEMTWLRLRLHSARCWVLLWWLAKPGGPGAGFMQPAIPLAPPHSRTSFRTSGAEPGARRRVA